LARLDELISEVDRARDELIELLQGMVRIPTINTGTMPTGNETELCRFIKAKFDKEKIESEIIESVPTRGNFISRLNTQRYDKARLMLMSHIDVVPIGDEKKWLHPPFSGKLDGGRIYGRGADDCKGLTACEAMVMILMKRLKVPLKKGLILAAGCDEETGSKYGFQWLAKNNKELINSDYAINEGGGEAFQTPKGLCFTVALGEKGRLDAKIKLKGKSCHASIPWEGDNALVKLSKAVLNINNYDPIRDLSASAFRDIPNLFGVDESEITPENIDNLISKLSSDKIDSMLRGLSRMTITPTMASGGIKSNVIPDDFTLTCDVRLLPGQTIDYARNELHSILNGIEGYELDIQGTPSPIASSPDDAFLQAIRDGLGKVIGKNTEIIRSITVGLTDSCAVRQLGTIVYNFAPNHPDPGSDASENNVHGDNESISVKDLVFRTKVLAAIAYNMLA